MSQESKIEHMNSAQKLEDHSGQKTVSIALAQVHEAFHRGDIQAVRNLIQKLDPQHLSDEEKKSLTVLQKRLKFDRVEFYLPIGLFLFWAVIFWQSTH